MTATYAANTEVPWTRSRDEIERTLARYGADEFAYARNSDRAQLGFLANGRRVAFILPLPARAKFALSPTGQKRTDAAVDKAWEQAQRQRWRALALVIKAKLEAVEAGIVTFDDEFASHYVLPDGSQVRDHLTAAIEEAYQSGGVPPLQFLGGRPALAVGPSHDG